MQETKILVVDDEKEIADLVEIYLVSDGYKNTRRTMQRTAWIFWQKRTSSWCCWTS